MTHRFTFKRILNAIIFIAVYAHIHWANGQNSVENKPSAVCTPALELRSAHLYGQWRVEFEDGLHTTLRLHKNANHADSLAGYIQRGGADLYVAGDIDDGEFSLEETQDGTAISALWTGEVVPGSCGKEIRGTWRNTTTDAEQKFVLRKVPGWD
jgi:hypothetical protein